MRLRLALTAILAVAVLAVAASAQAYPWPLKPFNRQHPIRANFGDPRTRFFNTMLTNGLEGPGMFQFHNGIDIAAPGDTPVYPVATGTARLIDGAAVSVRSKGRTFQYFHISPTILNGDHVVAMAADAHARPTALSRTDHRPAIRMVEDRPHLFGVVAVAL